MLCKHDDGSWTLYLSDTGDQMEFQELLPLLVSGPSLFFFIVFPLHRDLNEFFTIEYELPDGQWSKPYQSSLTLKEAILQSLATIAVMGTFSYKGMDHCVELKPKVGTHKNLLNPGIVEEDIKKKDEELQQIIKSMLYYREGLVEFVNQLIFTVNNLAVKDDDFVLVRSRVDMIAKRSEYHRIKHPCTLVHIQFYHSLMQDFEQIYDTASAPLLTHSRFLQLLKHLRIVPFRDGVKFLIPCVLERARDFWNARARMSAHAQAQAMIANHYARVI